MEALRGKYKLGVISDTWPSIVPVLEEFGLPGYFDTLTYSFEVGCFKPDPRMFADALGKMGLPPEQCVFIDDTAQNLGGRPKAGHPAGADSQKARRGPLPPGDALHRQDFRHFRAAALTAQEPLHLFYLEKGATQWTPQPIKIM